MSGRRCIHRRRDAYVDFINLKIVGLSLSLPEVPIGGRGHVRLCVHSGDFVNLEIAGSSLSSEMLIGVGIGCMHAFIEMTVCTCVSVSTVIRKKKPRPV